MTRRLSGHFSVFDLVFFVLKSLLGMVRQRSRGDGVISILCFTPFTVRVNSTNWPAPNLWVLIAQLVEHCSANAAAMSSNPAEVPPPTKKRIKLLKLQLPLRPSYLHLNITFLLHEWRTAKPSLNLNNRVSPALYHRGRSKKSKLVDLEPVTWRWRTSDRWGNMWRVTPPIV